MKIAAISLLLIVFPTFAQNQILSPYEQRDLQLFSTYQQEPGLLSAIDHTRTTLGHEYLKKQLSNPLIDISALISRQKGIAFLLEHENIYQELRNELSDFATYESTLAMGLADTDSICNNTIGNFYFKNNRLRWLNNYPLGLELGQVAHVVNLSFPLIEHLVIHFLLSEKLKSSLGIECGHSHPKGEACDHTHGTTGAIAAYGLYNIFHTGIHIAGAKGLLDHVCQQSQVIVSIQQDLINLNKTLDHAYATLTILRQNPALADLVHGHSALENLFAKNGTKSAQLKEFLTLMDKNTFYNEPSFFSRMGNILRAYALLKEVHSELRESLHAIGYLDFLANCAFLMRSFKDTETPYTFVRYATQSAQLSIEGFWNPLFKDMQPISHCISLGSNNPSIAIVTGPNKAGKSTSLQAISLATVLAQTLTIVPAKHMELSPFAYFKTGFNMPARVNHGQSLFSASLDFAKDIIETAQQNPELPLFIAIDELFNSTAFDQGTQIAQRFCQELAALPNCICFMATHFNDLTQLEAQKPAQFKNFKAELTTNSNNQTCYILAPGISEVTNVLQLVDQETGSIRLV